MGFQPHGKNGIVLLIKSFGIRAQGEIARIKQIAGSQPASPPSLAQMVDPIARKPGAQNERMANLNSQYLIVSWKLPRTEQDSTSVSYRAVAEADQQQWTQSAWEHRGEAARGEPNFAACHPLPVYGVVVLCMSCFTLNS